MNDLQKMKKSCEDFAKDLKTGNVEWENKPHDYFAFAFKVKTNLGEISLFYDNRFFYTFNDKSFYLKSTTAKEAAHEAIQLVKAEAQKLVDALSEPIQTDLEKYSPEFLAWRDKYFYLKIEVTEWKSKRDKTPFNAKYLEQRYQQGHNESPFKKP